MNADKIIHLYFKVNDNEYRIYDLFTNYGTFKTVSHDEYRKIKKRYEMLAGYEASDNGLLLYTKDFKQWNTELLNHYKIHKSHLTFFLFKDNNDLNIVETFYNFSKKVYDIKNNSYDIIDYEESTNWEQCNNGGLMFCDSGIYNCYGYDYNSFFPRLLGQSKYKLQIPLNKGKSIKLNVLDFKNIQYGTYKVRINCEDKRFFFNYSKDNTYTHFSLLDAIKYQSIYKINIELINDTEYNAYVYEEKDLIYTSKIFGAWFNELNEFKQKHPKNRLVKHLMSSLWGSLSKKNITYVKEDDLENYEYGFSANEKMEYVWTDRNSNIKNSFFTLVKREQPYKYNIRLKPFLLSFSRSIMLDIAVNNHPNEIVRIMVDNIVYKSNVSFDVEHMSIEDKTTGHIEFKNVMKYNKIID